MIGTLYTLGYGKLKGPDDLAKLVADEPIDIVLDVRASPSGRNPLWRAGLVPETVRKAGIPDYRHVPALGNPDFRSNVPAYRLADEGIGMAVLAEVLESGRNVALMCVCRETAHCHRRLIVAKARQLYPDLRLVELEVDKEPVRSDSATPSGTTGEGGV